MVNKPNISRAYVRISSEYDGFVVVAIRDGHMVRIRIDQEETPQKLVEIFELLDCTVKYEDVC